jgi:RNA polymerase-binding transcription factor DksA
MKRTELEQFREKLHELATKIQSEASSLTEQTKEPSGGQGSGELTNAPLHLGDMGTQEYLHDLNATLLQNEEYIANEVVAALRRIEEKTFGRCEACGKPIPKGRLLAIAYARFCVGCAEANQAGPEVNLNAGRPMRPQDTLAPEGEMNEEGRVEEQDLDELTVYHSPERQGDVFAAGTAGGGTSEGGLAGSNVGHGDPDVGELNAATGSGDVELEESRRSAKTPALRSGPSGGAVGGTPARKRAK